MTTDRLAAQTTQDGSGTVGKCALKRAVKYMVLRRGLSEEGRLKKSHGLEKNGSKEKVRGRQAFVVVEQ